jgi:hypothetical protein
MGSSFEVLLHCCSTDTGISLTLLHRWLNPGSEWPKVRKVVGVCVGRCVPKLEGSRLRAARKTSHDGLPHVWGRIDAHSLAVALDSVDDLGEEVAVTGEVGVPAAAGSGVGLDLDPDSIEEHGGDDGHDLVDLHAGFLSLAGVDVDVGGEAD